MKSLLHISKPFWISIFLLLTICPLIGQIKKLKKVAPEDYHLWSTRKESSISDDAKWASYIISYESAKDTLFVKSTINDKLFCFPKGSQGTFLDNMHFGYMLPDNKFQLVNLQTGAVVNFENITKFESASNTIILKEELPNGKKKLHLLDYNGTNKQSITDITYYKLSPNGIKLAYSNALATSSIAVFDFQKQSSDTIITKSAFSFPIIKWDLESTALVFCDYSAAEKSYHSLYFYNIKNKKLRECNSNTSANWPDNMVLDARNNETLIISDNQQSVFFSVLKKEKPNTDKKKEGVEIWNAKDKDLFPKRMLYGTLNDLPRIAMWTTLTNTVKLIGDEMHPQALINPNQTYALVYNENENKPTFKEEPDITYWLFNSKTGAKTMFLEKQPVGVNFTYFSPLGKYFLYFKNQNWWLYSFEKQKHINLTGNSAYSFADYISKRPGTPSSFGCAGWTKDDHSVLLYDEFDLWEFNTLTGKSKRLTSGREKKEIYRFKNQKRGVRGNFISKEQIVIPGENLILNVKKVNNSYSGFSYLDIKRKLHNVVYDSAYVYNIQKAKTSNTFLYIREKFNTPPALLLTNGKSTKKIFQTNPQHNQYAWGKSELITYKNSKGASLNGVLYYPSDFDPKRIYPMIVNIYEKQTYRLHVYTNPSNLLGCDINTTNYTTNGYFVLLPDIDYEIGNPGFSALDCVTSAVKNVTDNYPVNKEKIGLMGHSFGGYETDFIITQTNIFAAAVSGAAITNFNSYYLEYSKGSFKPESWRFEYYQLRMGTTLFEDYNNYQNNSPVTHAAKISTPLLSYTGKVDTNVDPVQSKEFYLALRRLQKEHVLLVYPNENHVFSNPESNSDLTQKREEWFGHFLKDQPKPKWMDAL